jgi:hypothetical protein
MASVPDYLLRHRVTIAAYLGEGAYGPEYDTPVTGVLAFVADKRRLVRDRNGDEVVSETTVILKPGTVCPPESTVTVWPGTSRERTSRVITASDHDGGGLPTPDHVELALL